MIRADLQQVYGVDLVSEWKKRRWRKLLILIEQLPPASRFTQAYLTDEANADALALAQLKADDEKVKQVTAFTEWNLQTSMLASLIDAIHVLQATVTAIGGGKPHKVEPYPRPVSVGQAALEKARAEAAEDFVNQILPDR